MSMGPSYTLYIRIVNPCIPLLHTDKYSHTGPDNIVSNSIESLSHITRKTPSISMS